MEVGTLEFGLDPNSIFIYPYSIINSTNLTFTLTDEKELDLILTDLDGKVITHFFTNKKYYTGEHQINLEFPTMLSTGNYFITLLHKQNPFTIHVFKK